ncbi:MAG TPA: hypothetical protein DHD79_09515 [Firmicutes bacterium]|nr:hypothetical protein [Bacillota bacterium]HAW71024.1 hypothetical protein [Bacillota bacterium]HAZ21291.1 hypothetical protein [Bacillota bacterium]HBE05263.1 hypothetical protein [Bacillota bacterium]HBG44079.1 hypothetical protein [Bacillota bacterium]
MKRRNHERSRVVSNYMQLLHQNMETVYLVLAALVLLLLVIVVILLFRVSSLKKRFERLMLQDDGVDLEGLINNYKLMADDLAIRSEKLEQVSAQTCKDMERHIQNVALVRYSAFEQGGGELSFSAAMLDKKGDGVIFTSIFGRDEARFYGKPVKAGKSEYNLSDEEKQAIKEAMKK